MLGARLDRHPDSLDLYIALNTRTPLAGICHVTPEVDMAAASDADRVTISRSDMAAAWTSLNDGPDEVDFVAIDSLHPFA